MKMILRQERNRAATRVTATGLTGNVTNMARARVSIKLWEANIRQASLLHAETEYVNILGQNLHPHTTFRFLLHNFLHHTFIPSMDTNT